MSDSNKLRLGVNIDHVATVRNARGSAYPDPVRAAKLAEKAGADGITAHLREDRRHIRDEDIDGLTAALGDTAQLRNGGNRGDAGNRSCVISRMRSVSCPRSARSGRQKAASTLRGMTIASKSSSRPLQRGRLPRLALYRS